MISAFLDTIANAQTRRSYDNDLQQFTVWCNDAGVELITLRPKQLSAYRSVLLAKYAPATVNRKLSSVRSYLAWAVCEELVEPGVLGAATAISGTKVPFVAPRLITDEEFGALVCLPDVRTVKGARDVAFLYLLRASGGRLSELVGLNVEDLGKNEAIVIGKGGDEGIIYFDDEAQAAVRNYLQLRAFPVRGPVFVGPSGERLTDRRLHQIVAELGNAAGRSDLHPHLFRHTLLTELLEQTDDIEFVRRVARHKRIETTLRYTAQANRREKEKYLKARHQVVSVTLELPQKQPA